LDWHADGTHPRQPGCSLNAIEHSFETVLFLIETNVMNWDLVAQKEMCNLASSSTVEHGPVSLLLKHYGINADFESFGRIPLPISKLLSERGASLSAEESAGHPASCWHSCANIHTRKCCRTADHNSSSSNSLCG